MTPEDNNTECKGIPDLCTEPDVDVVVDVDVDVDVEAPSGIAEEEVLSGETMAVGCLKEDNGKIMGTKESPNVALNWQQTFDEESMEMDQDKPHQDPKLVLPSPPNTVEQEGEEEEVKKAAQNQTTGDITISPMKPSSANMKDEDAEAFPSAMALAVGAPAKMEGVSAPVEMEGDSATGKMEEGTNTHEESPTILQDTISTGVIIQDTRGGFPAPLRLTRNSAMFPNQTPGAYHVTGVFGSPNRLSSRAVTNNHGPGVLETPQPPEEMTAFNAELVCETEISPTETASTSTEEQKEEELPPVLLGTTVSHKEEDSKRFWFLSLAGILVLLLVVVFLSLGLSGVFAESPNEIGDEPSSMEVANSTTAPTTQDPIKPTRRSTLDIVRETKVLRAGFEPYTGSDSAEPPDFLNALTRSIGAGIMGPEGVVEYVQTPIPDIFASLMNGTIDIILFGATHTMDRDVFMESTKDTVSFSIPYNYEGLRIGGDPFYVSCIDDNFNHLDECDGLRICTTKGTIYRDIFLAERLPRSYVVETAWEEGGIWEGLVSGKCNLIAESSGLLELANIRGRNGTAYEGDYALSQKYFSHSPEAAVTRPNDPEFVDAINAVLWSLMAAEEHNITQNTTQSFPRTTLFGEEHKDMFRDAIALNGNLGEIYQRHTQMWRGDRHELVHINNGSTGLLYSHPFGSVATVRNDKPLSDTLQAILQRKKLRCGIPANRPGFSSKLEHDFVGMDVDYCRAISASLFGGSTKSVEFVEVEADSDGYALLASHEVDMLAGATWTLENDVNEPTTGQGYTFSQPYFYGFSKEHDNFALATRQDEENEDWSRFIFWVVTASFYAEEKEIDWLSSIEMPEVFLYGPGLKRMFRDSIFGVGNYGEMYERNLADLYPRQGRNHLNQYPNSGAQHYPIPGFF